MSTPSTAAAWCLHEKGCSKTPLSLLFLLLLLLLLLSEMAQQTSLASLNPFHKLELSFHRHGQWVVRADRPPCSDKAAAQDANSHKAMVRVCVFSSWCSLMKEASPLGAKRMVEMGEEHRQMTEEDDLFNVEDAGERKLLSRYGIWLLVELCRPQEDIPIVSCWLSQPWFVKKTNLKVYTFCRNEQHYF